MRFPFEVCRNANYLADYNLSNMAVGQCAEVTSALVGEALAADPDSGARSTKVKDNVLLDIDKYIDLS